MEVNPAFWKGKRVLLTRVHRVQGKLAVAEIFPGKWLSIWSLNSMPLWSVKSKEAQARQVEDSATVVTVEDHLMDAGFGSWLWETTSMRPVLLARIKIKALESKVCGMVKQATLNAEGGLVEEALCA